VCPACCPDKVNCDASTDCASTGSTSSSSTFAGQAVADEKVLAEIVVIAACGQDALEAVEQGVAGYVFKAAGRERLAAPPCCSNRCSCSSWPRV
jgi:hypothetical protein